MTGVSFSSEAENYLFVIIFKTFSVPHYSLSHPVGVRRYSLGLKCSGMNMTTHLHLWSYSSTQPFFFISNCLMKHKEKFTFSFSNNLKSVSER